MEKGLPPSHRPEAGAGAARRTVRLRKKEELSVPVVTSSAKGLPEVCVLLAVVVVEELVDACVPSAATSLPYGLLATQLLR